MKPKLIPLWSNKKENIPNHWVSYPPIDCLSYKYLTSLAKQKILPYQSEGVSNLSYRRGGLLAWACGAGKTFGSLVRAAQMVPERVLVITRSGTKDQWGSQINKWTEYDYEIIKGQKQYNLTDTIFKVINWEILPSWFQTLEQWSPELIIYDEVHKAKQWKRKERIIDPTTMKPEYHWLDSQAATAARLAPAADARLGLSATPVPKSLMDLWSILDILEPGCWDTSWNFAHQYCNAKQGEYGLDTSGRSNIKELKERLKTIFHYVRSDVVAQYMPKKVAEVINVPEIEQVKPANFKYELLNAKGNTASLYSIHVQEAASRKRKWVVNQVEDLVSHKQNVVILTSRHKEVEGLYRDLRTVTEYVYASHGGLDSPEQRGKLTATYLATGGVFIGTLDAFGEATDDFRETDVGIAAMLPRTPKELVQFIGRFGRLGGRSARVLFPIAEGTVDEGIAEKLLDRVDLVAEITDDDETRILATCFEGVNEGGLIANILAEYMGE